MKMGGKQEMNNVLCLYLNIKREISNYLPDFDRCANKVGDARQGATLATLGVRDHSAVTTLQRDLPKFDPLSAGHTGLWLNDLRHKQDRI